MKEVIMELNSVGIKKAVTLLRQPLGEDVLENVLVILHAALAYS